MCLEPIRVDVKLLVSDEIPLGTGFITQLSGIFPPPSPFLAVYHTTPARFSFVHLSTLQSSPRSCFRTDVVSPAALFVFPACLLLCSQ